MTGDMTGARDAGRGRARTPRRTGWLGRRDALAVIAATGLAVTDGAPALATTDIQRVVSPGGIVAWLVEERAIPIISIEAAFDGGASLDPDGLGGVASVFASMGTEGAGERDSAAFAEAAERVAARMGFSAGRDSVSFSVTMLAENMDESLALARDALLAPRYDQDALERVVARTISRVRQAETNPNRIAGQTWFAAQFPDDPYGRPRLGSEESLSAITPDDLRAARERLLNRETMVVGVVGAISAEELGPILDDLFGALPSGPPAVLPGVAPQAAGGVRVERFDAPQSTVLFGHQGPKRAHPDFIAASVMNYVLGGGGFASRLTEEVREKRGLAYGVSSYLAPLDRAGLYLGSVATDNDRVSESIDIIRREWARMASDGVTEEELAAAKRYLTGSYPLRFDSNSKIAGFLVAAQREDLGIDYIKRRNALVEAVTLEDVRRVAQAFLKPDDLFFTVVGRPVGL